MPGERHAGPLRKSNGSGPRRFGSFESFKGFKRFRGLEGFRGLRAANGKLGCLKEAIDVALGCLLVANPWRTANWTAQKKQWIWPETLWQF